MYETHRNLSLDQAESALIEESHFVRDAANNRLRMAFDAEGSYGTPVRVASIGAVHVPADPLRTVWSQAFGSWGHTVGDGNAAALDRSTGGVLLEPIRESRAIDV